jgi:hypothetical protein
MNVAVVAKYNVMLAATSTTFFLLARATGTAIKAETRLRTGATTPTAAAIAIAAVQ